MTGTGVLMLRVRSGAQSVLSGITKGPGFQYPDAIVAPDGELVVVYSVNKEEIAVTRVPLGRER